MYNDAGIRNQKTLSGVSTKYHIVDDKVTYGENVTDRIYYTYDSPGKLISMKLSTKNVQICVWSTPQEYYYIRNVQDEIIGLFDKTGALVVSYSYDSLGKPYPEVKDSNSNALPTSGITGSKANAVGVKNPYM